MCKFRCRIRLEEFRDKAVSHSKPHCGYPTTKVNVYRWRLGIREFFLKMSQIQNLTALIIRCTQAVSVHNQKITHKSVVSNSKPHSSKSLWQCSWKTTDQITYNTIQQLTSDEYLPMRNLVARTLIIRKYQTQKYHALYHERIFQDKSHNQKLRYTTVSYLKLHHIQYSIT